MDVWGERGRPACGFGRRARNSVGQISWLTGFRRDAENGNRDGCAPRRGATDGNQSATKWLVTHPRGLSVLNGRWIPPSIQDGFCFGRLVAVRKHPDTLCLANFRLSRWDERRCQMQFGLDVWGGVALNLCIMKIKILLILFASTFVALAQTNSASTNSVTEFRMVGKVKYDVSQPPFISVTIPAGAALLNAASIILPGEHPMLAPPIHFDGTIKPISVSFLLPEINNHTKNFEVSIYDFPYTPTLFKEGQLRIVKPISQMTVYYDTFHGLVAKSNLVLRVFPMSHPQTNYDALGRATITPAQPVFNFGLPSDSLKNDQPRPLVKGDVAQMSLVAGIYRFAKPNTDRTEKMDLRSDGTAQTSYYYDNSSSPMGKQNVNWSAAAGVVTVNDLIFKIENEDLIDADGNRWLRVR